MAIGRAACGTLARRRRGSANYFADTPHGAWAEFVRHEGITDATDLAGVRRSLWAVELPHLEDDAVARPALAQTVLAGDESSDPACQAQARRAQALGLRWLLAPSAALWPGQAAGWTATPTRAREALPREGSVWVHFGWCALVGWPVVEAGQPPTAQTPMVRHF